jgi:hypothetical protein
MKPSAEYSAFSSALKRVLQVSKSDMKAILDAEKQAKIERKKQTSGHASHDKN